MHLLDSLQPACCISYESPSLLDVLTRQWQRDGLAVRGDRSDYSVSQLQLLGTRTSIAAEETAAVLRSAACDCGPPCTITAAGDCISWQLVEPTV